MLNTTQNTALDVAAAAEGPAQSLRSPGGARPGALLGVLAGLALVPWARADEIANGVRRILERHASVLRAVEIGLETEDGKRAELQFTGVVVSPRGMALIFLPPSMFEYPRSYFKRCELIRPGHADEPHAGRLVAMNEVAEIAFVEPIPPATSQPCADFAVAAEPPRVGTPLIALGLLGPELGFRVSAEVVRVGPPAGHDEFTVVDSNPDTIGFLLYTLDGRLVAVNRGAPEEEAPAPNESNASAGFMQQPLVSCAAGLAEAVAYAVEHRRDRPEPWMGIAGLSVAGSDVCAAYGLPKTTVAVVVGAVVAGFPAEVAGLRPKDFIIKFNGESLKKGATDEETLDDWTRSLKGFNVGEPVTLTVWRDRQATELQFKLAEAPTPASRADRDFSRALGVTVRELVFRDRFDRRLEASQSGVVVAQVTQSGPFDTAELQEEDIIQKIDETPIADLPEYRRTVGKKLAAHPPQLVFSVLRGTSERIIARVELSPSRSESAPTSRPR